MSCPEATMNVYDILREVLNNFKSKQSKSKKLNTLYFFYSIEQKKKYGTKTNFKKTFKKKKKN